MSAKSGEVEILDANEHIVRVIDLRRLSDHDAAKVIAEARIEAAKLGGRAVIVLDGDRWA